MAASATTVRTTSLDTEVMLAAGAVFGALEIIGESNCDALTEKRVERAVTGAEAALAEIGLSRGDLCAPHFFTEVPAPQYLACDEGPPVDRPPDGIVVPLRRSGRAGRPGLLLSPKRRSTK